MTDATTGTILFFHGDHLGSASVMTDYGGDEKQRLQYFPYGGTRYDSKPADESVKHRFTGHEKDFAIGIYYAQARYYDQRLARFISCDPAGPQYEDPQTLNPYSYCLNNPLKYVDPTGEIVLTLLIAAAVIGVGTTIYGVCLFIESVKTAETGISQTRFAALSLNSHLQAAATGYESTKEGLNGIQDGTSICPFTSLNSPSAGADIAYNLNDAIESGADAIEGLKSRDSKIVKDSLTNMGFALFNTLVSEFGLYNDFNNARGDGPSQKIINDPEIEGNGGRGKNKGSNEKNTQVKHSKPDNDERQRKATSKRNRKGKARERRNTRKGHKKQHKK